MAKKEALQDTNVSKMLFDGKTMDVRVEASLTEANLSRTITGASTIEMTLYDPDKGLINSDLFTHEVDVELDFLKFALVAVNKNGYNLGVTMEDWAVAQLRKITKPMKANRAKMTRAQFAKRIVSLIPGNSKFQLVDFYSPELDIVQPIAKKTDLTPKEKKDANKKSGFADKVKLTIKGSAADKEQLKNLDIILSTGNSMGADGFLMITAIAVAIDESNVVNLSGGDATSAGVFQQISTGWGTLKQRTDVAFASNSFFASGLKKQKLYPKATYAGLATAIQNPQVFAQGENSAYYKAVDRWVPEAIDIYSAWSGSSVPGGTPGATAGKKIYEFHLGGANNKGENAWTCLQRLANEVNWRCYSVGSRIYFLPDRDLYKARPIDTLSEDDPSVDNIDFDFDTGKKVNHATVTCHATRWIAPPGACVVLEKLGPANGRWLVETIGRSLYLDTTTIALVKPQQALPEPKASASLSKTNAAGKKINDNKLVEQQGLSGEVVVRLAYQWIGLKYKGQDAYHLGGGHQFTYKQLLTELITPPFDCSSLVAYAWAKGGHVDLTGTAAQQIAKGRASSWVQGSGAPPKGGWLAGDLLFPHDHHVNISMGDGTMIGAHKPSIGISITLEYTSVFYWCRPEPTA